MTEIEPFHGAKIALLVGDQIITFLRDDKPDIDLPGYWDLPGGGREGDETPEQCIIREVMEEFEIALRPAQIIWSRRYPSALPGRTDNIFMVGAVEQRQIDSICFGSEGQMWKLCSISDFLIDPGVVPHHQARLQDWLAEEHSKTGEVDAV